MANDPKIRIPIELPAGDQSGVEQAKKGIEEVKQATEAAEDPALAQQRIEDVAAARKIASERRIEEHEKALTAEKLEQQAAQDTARLRLAAGAALAASARQVAALTVEVIQQYRELGVELGAFEQIGLDFADFLTSPFDFVADAFTGYKGDLAALRESQRRVIEQEAIYQETKRAKEAATRKANEAFVNESLAAELAAIEAVTQAYERQRNEINARNSALEAGLRSAEDLAVSSGQATPEQVASQRAAREQAGKQADVNATVDEAAALYAEAAEKADIALANYASAQALGVATDAMASQVDAAIALRDKLALDLESVKKVAEANSAELAATAVSEQTGFASAAKDTLTKTAADAKATLESEAAEQGKTLSAGGKEALKILTEALKDGVVTPEEMQAVAVAIQQVRNSRDAADAEIKTAFDNLNKANEAAREAIQILNARSLDDRQKMEALRAQINAGG